ncbi:hypothetical protein [Rubellicoccus peritrichatus]|uniref:Uncharacterized protein n=1 Tax=Rubellicoccus peritrichatus TaxID=3080537 RepID=A0AAQ3L984_9BACT|nr:hypothetical protein [Puniceicoccus sp. CR14]WOO40042.1 hypothetical protein RZN69_15570 [Puniceicoccus sp. CR14]
MSEQTKTVPISGRIAQADYDFLMANRFGGKVTASEKLRHMASFFRHYHENFGDYADGLEELSRLLLPSRKNIKELENQLAIHSEVLDQAANVLPQALAFLISRQSQPPQNEALPYLLKTEERLLQLSLRMIEQILRFGLTSNAPAYNPRLLDDKLDTIVELIGLLSSREQKSPNTDKQS